MKRLSSCQSALCTFSLLVWMYWWNLRILCKKKSRATGPCYFVLNCHCDKKLSWKMLFFWLSLPFLVRNISSLAESEWGLCLEVHLNYWDYSVESPMPAGTNTDPSRACCLGCRALHRVNFAGQKCLLGLLEATGGWHLFLEIVSRLPVVFYDSSGRYSRRMTCILHFQFQVHFGGGDYQGFAKCAMLDFFQGSYDERLFFFSKFGAFLA